MIDHRRSDRRFASIEAGTSGVAIGNQEGSSFADLMREMPNAVFIELPCGEELASRTLLEIMLAIERAGSRLSARPEGSSEVIDLPAGVGFAASGERLSVFRKTEWTGHHSKVRVLSRP